VQDGRLSVSENHVLRFLADLLGLSPRKFAKLFEQVAHRPFPEVGDVSSVDWWRRREAGEQAKAPAEGWGHERPGWGAAAASRAAGAGRVGAEGSSSASAAGPPPRPGRGVMTRTQALELLALPEGASPEEIHSAYRRMAKVRHPDRFARLGPAAQATAAAAFQLVHDAYEVLTAA
jgi:DnaJ-domain-containing protein 1